MLSEKEAARTCINTTFSSSTMFTLNKSVFYRQKHTESKRVVKNRKHCSGSHTADLLVHTKYVAVACRFICVHADFRHFPFSVSGAMRHRAGERERTREVALTKNENERKQHIERKSKS